MKLSLYHVFADRRAILGTLGSEEWSDFENIGISTDRGSQMLPRHRDDTWHFGAGLHYRLNDQWLLMTGAAYDTSPVDDEDRTTDMPIDRQICLSFGSQYSLSKRVTLGGFFTHADYGKAKIDQPLLQVEFRSNDPYFLAFNVNWKF